MKQVITANAVRDLISSGAGLGSIPSDAIITPGAQDAINAYNNKSQFTSSSFSASSSVTAPAASNDRFPPLPAGVPTVPPEPIVPSAEYIWVPGGDPKTPEEIQRFFYSPEIVALKEEMVNVARKMWKRNMVDGNGGNITVRVGDNLVLCTPTLRSKGEVLVDEIALIDLDGNQKAGWRKRTSEALTHLAIMKVQPKCKSVIHGHPPYSTAFAVANIEPPTCLCSEAEIFTGPIKLVPYFTPGSHELTVAVRDTAKDNPAILLANHGVMAWGNDVEDAYWKMENMETACQTVTIAAGLNGGKLPTINNAGMKDIFEIRRSIGMEDPREGLEECQLCQNDDFGTTAVCEIPAAAPANEGTVLNSDAEALVKKLTAEIIAKMG